MSDLLKPPHSDLASKTPNTGAVRNVMFWTDPAQKSATGAEAIGEVVRLQGSIQGAIHLTVNIEMIGDADVASLTVERTGRVVGQIIADRVEVSGEVDGDLRVDFVHVRAGGRLRGHVECTRIRIDEGAVIDAEFRRGRAPAPSHPRSDGHQAEKQSNLPG